MKKVIIALVIIAAVVGVVLYVKSKKKGKDDEEKKSDPASEAAAGAAGGVYKNKTVSPDEAVSGLKKQPSGQVVPIRKSNPNTTRSASGLIKLGKGVVQRGTFGPTGAQVVSI